ncbi:MAG: S9 family peptidase [Chthoniobacterales bacterium]
MARFGLFLLLMSLTLTRVLVAQEPPVAEQKPHEVSQNGQTRNDPFFWLREKSNPQVVQYLQAENRYTRSALKPVEGLEQKLYREMRARIKEEDLSVPQKIDDYFYYSRTEAGKQYPVHCRKKCSLAAPEEMLLDENELARGQKYFRIGVFDVSPDHKLLAYSTDTDGSETYTLRIKDLETGNLLPDEINNTSYSFAWANDNKTFFYDQLDPARRPFKAVRHQLGTRVAEDQVVYEEKDERFFLEIAKSRSEKFIFVSVQSELTSEVRFLNADEPRGEFGLIRPREENVLYSVDHNGDRFFIVTNDHAKNFKVVAAPIANPGKENWHDFLAYDPRIKVDGLEAFQDQLAILERRNGLPTIRIVDLKSEQSHEIDFDEPTYEVDFEANPEFKTTVVRLSFSSLITPGSVIDYDMVARTKEVKKVTPVLGGYNKSDYIEERVFAKAEDGADIPISLFYKKGFQRDGHAPLYLTGYGAYGINNDAEFASTRLSLVDRGFVYAIAHIRGGGELGRSWYEDGKLLNKKNSFTDFIRSTEFLIDHKYCSPGKVAISGGSAGGLLMGAVMNMRPDLFTTVVALVPFVDVLNTMSDPSLPLTVTEYEEWGNPNEPKYFDYIASYSPYDNIQQKRYPNLLVTAGLNDPRVSYWEPAKWVAKQRTLKDQHRVLLLKTNLGAGHGGDSGRFDRLKEVALEYVFVLRTLGMAGAPAERANSGGRVTGLTGER